jgi:hypothetical protein
LLHPFIDVLQAEVVAAAARQWWPAWRQRRQLGKSAVLAVAAVRLEVRQQRGGNGGNNTAVGNGSMAYADNNCNGHDDNND